MLYFYLTKKEIMINLMKGGGENEKEGFYVN